MSHPLLKGKKIAEEKTRIKRIQNLPNKCKNRGVVFFVWRDPARVDFGFLGCLDHVSLYPLQKVFALVPLDFSKRPDPQQRLIKEILLIRVGDSTPLGFCFFCAIHLAPSNQMSLPFSGEFGKDVDASPNIFGSFRIVGRCRQHRKGPMSLPFLVSLMKRCRENTEQLWIAPHLV